MRRLALSLAAGLLGLAAVAAPIAHAQRAYVANSGSASVSVFETAANSPQGTIAVGSGPSDVAILPDGSRAYVSNSDDDTVSAIDTASNAVIATIPVGDEPKGVATTPDGSRVYVANRGADSISVISTAANGALGPAIAVGSEPEGVAVTPEGLRVLVAQRGGDISVIEVSSGSVIAAIPDALGPVRLALTPDGARGFAANGNSNSVSVFSLVTGTVLGAPILVGATPSGMALSPNGPAYAASSSDNTVVAIDPVTHSRIGPPIPGFAGPSGIASTADGAFAYVANSAAASVAVIDASTASVQGQIPVGLAPQGIAIVPDQPARALFVSERAKNPGQPAPLRRIRLERPRRSGCHLHLGLRRRSKRKWAQRQGGPHLRDARQVSRVPHRRRPAGLLGLLRIHGSDRLLQRLRGRPLLGDGRSCRHDSSRLPSQLLSPAKPWVASPPERPLSQRELRSRAFRRGRDRCPKWPKDASPPKSQIRDRVSEGLDPRRWQGQSEAEADPSRCESRSTQPAPRGAGHGQGEGGRPGRGREQDDAEGRDGAVHLQQATAAQRRQAGFTG